MLRGFGMSPTEPATSYRNHAAKCVLIAKKLLSVSDRLALIDMAEEWTALAQQAEKNPDFFALCRHGEK